MVAIVTLILLAACARPSAAQDHGYWASYPSDIATIATSPLRWEKREWTNAAIVLGATGAIYAFDQDIQDWFQENRSSQSNSVAGVVKHFGDGVYTLPMLGAFYLYGNSVDDDRARDTAAMGFESLAITSLFTEAIKIAGNRHRPDAGDGSASWGGPSFSGTNSSFPSLHSSTAFAVATVIATEYRDSAYAPPFAYGLATLTALSRVNDNDHWASDVFAGSALGYLTAKAVMGLHKPGDWRGVEIVPEVSSSHAGLVISTQF